MASNHRITYVTLTLFVLTQVLLTGVAPAAAQGMALAEDRASAYTIVLPDEPTELETHAAGELRRYLERITTVRLPIVSASRAPQTSRIFVGRAVAWPSLFTPQQAHSLGEDGLWIRTRGDDLILAGGTDQGPLYAVYTFLETYLGCRKYSPDVEHIPQRATIRLDDIDDRQVPRVRFRSMSYYDARDPAYRAWHKLDSVNRSTWGMWVHTFSRLVPPDEYYDEHPEYFALVEGKRARHGQLALTNEAVFDIVVRELRRRMEENPDATFWSVSQNDTYQFCQSPEATAINEREGTPMGELLTFVNRVAGEFPDKTISTLAYQYSRKPPRHLRPAPNVNIVLCSIECNRGKPLATDAASDSFREDLLGWTAIADDILVWNYCIQFSNLISPFPNLRVLGPNTRFFVDHGVTAFFQQGNREIHGEFDHLRAYLIAKLLWDPSTDVDIVIDDFLNGYYGPAGRYLRQYIDIMHDALEESGGALSIYGDPVKPSLGGYLRPALMQRYELLFDQAEAAVADQPTLHKRVLVARLPLRYAIIEQAVHAGVSERGVFRKDAQGRWLPREEIRQEMTAFTAGVKRLGVRRLKEWRLSPDEYQAEFERFIARGVRTHKAFGRPVRFIDHPPSDKYYAGGESALTNGILGGSSFDLNYLGFEGTDMIAQVDLGQSRTVSHIDIGAIQDLREWIFLPKSIAVYVSTNGNDFRRTARLTHDVSPLEGGVFSRRFVADFPATEGRYVRVVAEGMKTCPPGHDGAGRPAWLFVDEMIVD